MIKEILDEMNLENGSNYKAEVVKKHKDNELFQRVVSMALDKAKYTYGITMKNIPEIASHSGAISLTLALTALEQDFATRKVTGDVAIIKLEHLLLSLSKDDAYVLELVIGRDLKVNFGKTLFNKIIKGLITKPSYQRCDIGTNANIKKNIDFNKKVHSDLKMDGTFRFATIDKAGITIMSRSGNEDSFPIIEEELRSLDIDGYTLLGEMTLKGEQNRTKGNGLINSHNPPHEDIIYTVWDMIPAEEYSMDKAQIKAATKAGTLSALGNRREKLKALLAGANLNNVQMIEYREIKNMREAYRHFQEVTKRGDEGTVIKTEDLVWKDGTSKQQLKVKLAIELEMRFSTYNEGNKGSKNEDYFSGINFENDEGTIKGTIGVTSMTEKERDWFHENRDGVQGSVFTMSCNDITKARDSEIFALSHPRYEEIRVDKNQTDTLERALELKEMAMELS